MTARTAPEIREELARLFPEAKIPSETEIYRMAQAAGVAWPPLIDRDPIVVDIQSGEFNQTEIAKRQGVSIPTVVKIAEEIGHVWPWGPPREPPNQAAIVQDYESGIGITEIAKTHGFDPSTIDDILTKAHVVRRTARKVKLHAAIVEEYNSGMKVADIAARHGVTYGSITWALRKNNVTMRPQPRRPHKYDDAIRKGLESGDMTYDEIATAVGCSRALVDKFVAANDLGGDFYEAKWEAGLVHLRRRFEANGTAYVSGDFVDDDGYRTGEWLANVRSQNNRGNLSDERVADLNAIDTSWSMEVHIKGRCPRGHPYDRIDNLGRQWCSQCDKDRKRRERVEAAAAAGTTVQERNGNKTHCKRGHEFTPENTRIMKGGGRACRACAEIHNQDPVVKAKNAAYAAKKRAAKKAT